MIFAEHYFQIVIKTFLFGFVLVCIYEFFSLVEYIFGLKDTKILKSFASKTNNKFENNRFKKICLFIADFLFFVFVTPLCAIFLFGINNGIIRWYLVLATILGFAFFKITVGYLLDIIVQALSILMRYLTKSSIGKSFDLIRNRVKFSRANNGNKK